VDLLRGWAVFVMIETHVVNAVLLLPLREDPFFKALTFVNGLVAPTFLFCAGFGFAISFSRKWEEYIMLRPPAWRYIRRLLFILAVAYSLHIPLFSLRQMLALSDASLWMGFFQADILQIIALTLLGLIALAVAIRKKEAFVPAVAALALAVVYVSPVVRAMDHSALPVWFRPYLSLQFKSQFPIFPWSAFLLAGVLAGTAFVRARAAGRERTLVNRFGAAALLAVVGSLLVELVPWELYPGLSFWNASPQFFFLRLGLVMLACVALWWYCERKPAEGASLLTLFGQESLLVYATHLVVVYGHTFSWSFISLYGKTRGYWECFGLTALLVVGMYALAYGWHALKAWNMRAAHAVQYATILAMAGYFVLN
jgi:uncharacterized membrane protein